MNNREKLIKDRLTRSIDRKAAAFKDSGEGWEDVTLLVLKGNVINDKQYYYVIFESSEKPDLRGLPPQVGTAEEFKVAYGFDIEEAFNNPTE